jgi:hypothetical protein
MRNDQVANKHFSGDLSGSVNLATGSVMLLGFFVCNNSTASRTIQVKGTDGTVYFQVGPLGAISSNNHRSWVNISRVSLLLDKGLSIEDSAGALDVAVRLMVFWREGV